jgi:hypothetical protein
MEVSSRRIASDTLIPLNNRAVGWSRDVIGTIADRDATAGCGAVNGEFGLGLEIPIPTFCAAALDTKSSVAEVQAATATGSDNLVFSLENASCRNVRLN